MIFKVLDDSLRLDHMERAEPVCGTDFCDDCGCCLACYNECPCCPQAIVYADKFDQWRTEHPDAQRLESGARRDGS